MPLNKETKPNQTKPNHNETDYKSHIKMDLWLRWVDFNGMAALFELIYAKKLRNRVHCTFICTQLV